MSLGNGIILGGSMGIGRALVEEIAPRCSSVLVLSRSGTVPDHRPGVEGARVDITDFEALDRVFATAKTRRLDFVVNCVGIGLYAPIEEVHPDRWTAIIMTNVIGLLNLLAVLNQRVPDLPTFVHVSSLAAHRPSSTVGNECYTASKVAGRSLLEQFRTRTAAVGRPTRIVMVSPGYVRFTGFESRYFERGGPAEPVSIYGGQGALEPQAVARVIAGVLSTDPGVEVLDVLVCHHAVPEAGPRGPDDDR